MPKAEYKKPETELVNGQFIVPLKPDEEKGWYIGLVLQASGDFAKIWIWNKNPPECICRENNNNNYRSFDSEQEAQQFVEKQKQNQACAYA